MIIEKDKSTEQNIFSYYLQHPSVELSPDGQSFRLKQFTHPDNELLLRRRQPQNWTSIKSIKTAIALEGPIFQAASQLQHRLLVEDGLRNGKLCVDPITFAEVFSEGVDSQTLRESIYKNWLQAILHTKGSIAFTEYGAGVDPGVEMGAIMQLFFGRPVLGVALEGNNQGNNLFLNTIPTITLTPDEAISMMYNSNISQKIFDTFDQLEPPKPFPKKTQPEHDILIVHGHSIGGFQTAENIANAGKLQNKRITTIGELTNNLQSLHDLYDLAEIIANCNEIIVLGDDSAEPGSLAVEALQLAYLMEIPVFKLIRTDFRKLTGEGEGAGSKQPDQGLFGVQNLMIERILLPKGIYTKTASLVNDLKQE